MTLDTQESNHSYTGRYNKPSGEHTIPVGQVMPVIYLHNQAGWYMDHAGHLHQVILQQDEQRQEAGSDGQSQEPERKHTFG